MSEAYAMLQELPSMQPVRPYHHGKLKQELVDAAIALIAEVGPTGFTLREVARRAGVSHNAPYRHYRDRDELLAVVAMQGFERLTAAMQRSAARGSDPLERLRLCVTRVCRFCAPLAAAFLRNLLLIFLPAGKNIRNTLRPARKFLTLC